MWEKLCEQIFSHCMLSSPVRGTAHGRFLKQMQTRERSTLTPPLFSDGGLSPVLLWWRSKGSGVLSICFSCCQGVCTQQAACHTGRKLPRCPHHPEPPASFSTPCPAPITTPLSRSATWVMTTPGTLSPRCHFCHRISCWLRPCIPCLLFSAHVLTVNCLENRKGIEAAVKKKKIDQGPGKLKKKKQKKKQKQKMSLNVSYATISIPLTHFFWRRHSSAHRSGYSCLETIAGVLLRQLLSYCKADAFFSRQSI